LPHCPRQAAEDGANRAQSKEVATRTGGTVDSASKDVLFSQKRVICVRTIVLTLFSTCLLAQTQLAETTGFSTEERVRLYVYRTYSWQRMTWLGADVAFDQLVGNSRQWGQGPSSFANRYASCFGGRVAHNSIELGAGILFKEDTRYKPSNERTFIKRLRFAFTNTFLAQTDGGNRRFAYSRLAATVGGTLVASTWHPERRSPQDLMQTIGTGYLGHLQNSLLTEFTPDMVRAGQKMRARFFGR
jgi:hypothetical protein